MEWKVPIILRYISSVTNNGLMLNNGLIVYGIFKVKAEDCSILMILLFHIDILISYIVIVGDPDDKKLRRVEVEVTIPKKMRDIARQEKCPKEVAGKIFYKALMGPHRCRSSGISGPWKL